MSDELKPCRCEGGVENILIRTVQDISLGSIGYIECDRCGKAEAFVFYGHEDTARAAAEAWNTDRSITLEQAKGVVAANNCAIVPLEVSEGIKPLLEYTMDEWPSAKVVIGELGEMVARIDGTYLSETQGKGDG